MKTKKISVGRSILVIVIIIGCAIFGYLYSEIKVPYTSLTDAISNIRKKEGVEILDTIGRDDVYLVFFEIEKAGHSALYNDIIYKDGSKYYFDNGASSSKEIFDEMKSNYYISVRKMSGKIVVIVISNLLEKPYEDIKIKDSSESIYEKSVVQINQYSTIGYITVMRTLPSNFKLLIGNEIVTIN